MTKPSMPYLAASWMSFNHDAFVKLPGTSPSLDIWSAGVTMTKSWPNGPIKDLQRCGRKQLVILPKLGAELQPRGREWKALLRRVPGVMVPFVGHGASFLYDPFISEAATSAGLDNDSSHERQTHPAESGRGYYAQP